MPRPKGPAGYAVLVMRKNPPSGWMGLTYLGDERETAAQGRVLVNHTPYSATIFLTARQATQSIERSRRYWKGHQYGIDDYRIISLWWAQGSTPVKS